MHKIVQTYRSCWRYLTQAEWLSIHLLVASQAFLRVPACDVIGDFNACFLSRLAFYRLLGDVDGGVVVIEV